MAHDSELHGEPDSGRKRVRSKRRPAGVPIGPGQLIRGSRAVLRDTAAIADLLEATRAVLGTSGIHMDDDELGRCISFIEADLQLRYPQREHHVGVGNAAMAMLIRRSFVFVLAERIRAVETRSAIDAAGPDAAQDVMAAIGDVMRASRDATTGGYDPREWELPSVDDLLQIAPRLSRKNAAHLGLACVQSRMREQDLILEEERRDPRRFAASRFERE